MDAYEAVLDVLADYDHSVHHNDEKGYEHLGDEDVSITVRNGDSDDEILIEFSDGKIALFFGNDHDHFDPSYDDEVYWLVDLLDDLLHNRRCAASLYYNTDDFPKLMATSFCKKKETSSYEKVFDYVLKLSGYKEKLMNNGGKVVYRFFDPSLNFEEKIEKKSQDFS